MNINFEITSVIERGKNLLNNYENNTQLIFYAALETRYAIEIILDDWLNFLIEGSHNLADYLNDIYDNDIPDGSLDIPLNPKILKDKKKTKKYYSARKYKNEISGLVPEFEKRIEFMSILDSSFDRMKAPELSRLNTYYGRVGKLLHITKYDLKTEELYDDLLSILDYLEKHNEPSRCFLSLNVEGEKMFKKYINNKLLNEDLKELKNNGNKYYSGGLYQL